MLQHALVQRHERVVLVHGDLLQDHALLLVEVGLTQRRAQDVGQHLHSRRQVLGQHMRMEAGHLAAGERVVTGADAIEVLVHLQRAALLRTLEHHVFQEVAHTHQGRGFIPGAGANEESGCRGVGRRIHLTKDGEAIWKGRCSDGY